MTVSRSLAPEAVVARLAIASLVGHVAVGAIGVFAAVDLAPDPSTSSFWALAAFAALGAVATLLAWRASRQHQRRPGLPVAVALVGISALVVLYVALLRDGSAAVLLVAAPLVFMDVQLHSNVTRVTAGPASVSAPRP